MGQRRQGLYEDAEVYDILHAPGTESDVRGLLKIERRWVRDGPGRRSGRGLWLEPACGTGRLVIEAARRGRICIGIDRSESMVAYARARAEELGASARARFGVLDITNFARTKHARELGLASSSVSLAFNPINTIRHLSSDAAVLAHLAQIARVLRVGGVYAVGLSVSAPGVEGPTEDVWEGHRDGVRVKQVVEYEPAGWARTDGRRNPPRRERVASHLVVQRDGRESCLDDSYWLRSYTRTQWERLIGRSAMELVASVDEAGRPHDPGVFGYAIWLLARA
jgi:SAM-dependent methyltransferase